jgi:hypothetical protein
LSSAGPYGIVPERTGWYEAAGTGASGSAGPVILGSGCAAELHAPAASTSTHAKAFICEIHGKMVKTSYGRPL